MTAGSFLLIGNAHGVFNAFFAEVHNQYTNGNVAVIAAPVHGAHSLDHCFASAVGLYGAAVIRHCKFPFEDVGKHLGVVTVTGCRSSGRDGHDAGRNLFMTAMGVVNVLVQDGFGRVVKELF